MTADMTSSEDVGTAPPKQVERRFIKRLSREEFHDRLLLIREQLLQLAVDAVYARFDDRWEIDAKQEAEDKLLAEMDRMVPLEPRLEEAVERARSMCRQSLTVELEG